MGAALRALLTMRTVLSALLQVVGALTIMDWLTQ